jgi:hypothetical protein
MTLIDFFGHLATITNPKTQNDETTSGGGSGSDIRKFFYDLLEDYVEPVPIPNGLNLGFTRIVNSVTDWNNLPTFLQPGDVVKLNTNIPQGLTYRSNSLGYGGAGPYPNGLPEAPITIVCAAGVWIDPGNITGADTGLDIIRARHVHVVGVNVRNCRFPIRCITSGGSAGFPMKIHHCQTMQANEAQIYVGALSDPGLNASSYVSVMYNKVHDSSGNVPYSEGIYVGTGSTTYEWKDTTHDVEIAYNEVYNVRGDGIDIKPGAYNIFAHHNAIHDIGGDLGAGISACIPDTAYTIDPTPGTIKPIWIWSNWIWNVGYAFNGISGMANGIRANFAGMLVFNNIIWGLAVKGGGNTRGIDANVYQNVAAFATIFFNNTIWANTAFTNTVFSGTDDFYFFENLTSDGSQGQSIATLAADFIGPIPAINPTSDATTGATANTGVGPGSGFLLRSSSSHINVVVTTDNHRTTDATGISVPRNGVADRGAYEFV